MIPLSCALRGSVCHILRQRSFAGNVPIYRWRFGSDGAHLRLRTPCTQPKAFLQFECARSFANLRSSMPNTTRDPEVTPEIVARHGLTPEEFDRIKKILGREPNFTELGIFSVMWSEHCSYKNSRRELKKFPTTGPNILVKAGEENAGVVDIGDGWAVAFKIESHNHPSAIEPFQGAATGVGGIIRDIFTMGAR